MEIAAQSVDVALPFERPLYEPSRRMMVDDDVLAADDADVDAGALFSQFHVDKERLKANVDAVLAGAEQATLAEVTAAHPAVAGPGRDCGVLPAGHANRTGPASTRTTSQQLPGSSRTAASAKQPSNRSSS